MDKTTKSFLQMVLNEHMDAVRNGTASFLWTDDEQSEQDFCDNLLETLRRAMRLRQRSDHTSGQPYLAYHLDFLPGLRQIPGIFLYL